MLIDINHKYLQLQGRSQKYEKLIKVKQYGVYSPPGNSNVTKESEKQLKWPMKFKWPVTYPNIYSETSK